jgi:glycosyltransferase involved in cell wall biosynthesis
MLIVKSGKSICEKKILIVTEVFYPEEFKINDVALAWVAKGYDVDVLTLTPTYPLGTVFSGYKNWFFRRDDFNSIKIFRLRAVSGYKNSRTKKIWKYINFMFFGSIAALIIGRKYDLVFGFNISSLTDMFPAVVISKLYKKPTMFWVQDIWPDSVYAYGFKKTKVLSVFLDAFVKFMHHNIDAIAVSSKGFESKIKPYTKDNIKFLYAPNWADSLDITVKPVIYSEEEKIQFTFAGNVGKMQNLENIFQAFTNLPDDYQSKSQLNIIGDGSNLANLKMLAKNKKNIVFYGMQPREKMAQFYIPSDFLIVSLIDEPVFSVTVPAKTQTYIAAKKPILAIINGDVSNIVIDNNLGIYANPSDIEMIANSFQKCIDMSNSEKNTFIKNNEKLLKSTFNKDIVINNLLETLLSLKRGVEIKNDLPILDRDDELAQSKNTIVSELISSISAKDRNESSLVEPFFSIITINLNAGKSILSTLSSVKEQEFKSYEHILIDGGSKDISYEILEQNLENFTFFCSEKDNGIYDAINKGISRSKGKYLVLLHAGDYLKNSKTLFEISEYILNNPLHDVYLSDVIINSNNKKSTSYRYYPCDVFTTSRLRFGIMPPHPAMFIKRELHEKIGLYKTNYKIAGDFDFIVRVFQMENISYIACDKAFIRMRGGGLSDKLSNKILLQKEIFKICKDRNIKTNHFLLLFRYLIKLPEVIPVVINLKRYLKKKNHFF